MEGKNSSILFGVAAILIGVLLFNLNIIYPLATVIVDTQPPTIPAAFPGGNQTAPTPLAYSTGYAFNATVADPNPSSGIASVNYSINNPVASNQYIAPLVQSGGIDVLTYAQTWIYAGGVPQITFRSISGVPAGTANINLNIRIQNIVTNVGAWPSGGTILEFYTGLAPWAITPVILPTQIQPMILTIPIQASFFGAITPTSITTFPSVLFAIPSCALTNTICAQAAPGASFSFQMTAWLSYSPGPALGPASAVFQPLNGLVTSGVDNVTYAFTVAARDFAGNTFQKTFYGVTANPAGVFRVNGIQGQLIYLTTRILKFDFYATAGSQVMTLVKIGIKNSAGVNVATIILAKQSACPAIAGCTAYWNASSFTLPSDGTFNIAGTFTINTGQVYTALSLVLNSFTGIITFGGLNIFQISGLILIGLGVVDIAVQARKEHG